MITEYEEYYCKSCCKLYNDIIHNPYYTRNHFIDNQMRLIFDLPYNRKMEKPNYHSQCPHCYSKHGIKIKPIIELMDRKKWLRDNKGCNQYTKQRFKLYKEIMRKVTASKHLNTINDK